MREIATHKLSALNDAIDIQVLDEPDVGGANHDYRLTACSEKNEPPVCLIHFQTGPISHPGVNGFSNESFLAVVIDRLKGFQAGPFACSENALALIDLEEAMQLLHDRTRERISRGVEGTSAK